MSVELKRKPSEITARELLVEVAGPEHAIHTVVGKFYSDGDWVAIVCSCQALCTTKNTKRAQLALQNVPLYKEDEE